MPRFKYQTLFLIISFIVSLLISCSTSAEERDIKNTIKRYCDLLIKVYIQNEPSIIEEVATSEQVNRIVHLVEAVMAKNAVMINEQKRLKIKSVKISGDMAEAETDELWRYWLEDRYTRNVIESPREIRYRMIYSLKKIEGKWKVERTREIK